MKPSSFIFLGALFVTMALLSIACPSSQDSPTSPAATATPTLSPTPCMVGGTPCTGTPTPTSTKTFTPTSTPNCLVAGSITSNINGLDVSGDDTSSTPAIDLESYGPNAVVYSFSLASTQVVDLSLCPTLDASTDKVLILRSVCWDSTTDIATNDDHCDYLPALMGLTLSAGTYYLIEAAYSGADKGSFTLRARTGTLSPVYTVTPSATPQAAVEPNDTSVQAEDLGGGSSLGTGQVIRTGSADDGADANDYFSFVPLNGGTATAFIDGFDDGTEARDMDLYVYNGGLTQIASSVTSNPVDAVSFAVTAGQTYYLRVNAYFGSGPYRLTLKTP